MSTSKESSGGQIREFFDHSPNFPPLGSTTSFAICPTLKESERDENSGEKAIGGSDAEEALKTFELLEKTTKSLAARYVKYATNEAKLREHLAPIAREFPDFLKEIISKYEKQVESCIQDETNDLLNESNLRHKLAILDQAVAKSPHASDPNYEAWRPSYETLDDTYTELKCVALEQRIKRLRERIQTTKERNRNLKEGITRNEQAIARNIFVKNNSLHVFNSVVDKIFVDKRD